ncbi:MAG: DUF1453 family protein [Pseudomonadota bacterium]|nr:DUF1453 family protein [Pseudomonadota bacterium]
MDPKLLQSVLPYLAIGIVFALRFRNMNKPRPFNASRLWMMPAVLAATVAFFLVTFPPSPLGWLIVGFALLIGAVAGIKRGQWMHLERDPQTGKMLIRQSPAALIFLLGILVARRVLAYEVGSSPGADATGHIPPEALLVTDGLMAFALAMVVLMRWTLWQRAKAVPPHPEVVT